MRVIARRSAARRSFVAILLRPDAAAASVALAATLLCAASALAQLPQTIQHVRGSVVAVGTLEVAPRPRFQFSGTGFAVGDGTLIATNAHVLPAVPPPGSKGVLAIALHSVPRESTLREARIAGIDPEHDLALLRISGPPLPALRIAADAGATSAQEGRSVAFTGFPLGTQLGLFPVTHRAIISAISPIAIPSAGAGRLDSKTIERIRSDPYPVLQLDATSYPGQSGSALYDADTGEVVGIINMRLVKGEKETALSNPTAISYAIPAEHLVRMLERAGQKP